MSDIPIFCAHTELVDIEKLVPNPRNPNRHPESQISLLAKIIKGQGFRNPIVVSKRSGFVIKGHGRLDAAKLLEMSAVPVDFQDYESEAAEWADMVSDLMLLPPKRVERPSRMWVTKTCPACGMPFHLYPSEKSQVCCSWHCRNFMKSRNHPRWFSCMACGKQFISREKPHSNSSQSYCSRKCRNEHYAIRFSGVKNPNWRGGLTRPNQQQRHTTSYIAWRWNVFQRDNFTCVACGRRGVHLHAHHVKSYAHFPTLRFDITNGVTLCLDCHGQVHTRRFA